MIKVLHDIKDHRKIIRVDMDDYTLVYDALKKVFESLIKLNDQVTKNAIQK